MAIAPKPPDGTAAMAFQLVLAKLDSLDATLLQRLGALEHATKQMVPLLGKIIAHLEAQNKAPEVPIATYDQIYAELQDEAPGEMPAKADDMPVAPPAPRRRVRRWFTREVPSADE